MIQMFANFYYVVKRKSDLSTCWVPKLGNFTNNDVIYGDLSF